MEVKFSRIISKETFIISLSINNRKNQNRIYVKNNC